MSDWSSQRERSTRSAVRLILWIALHLGRAPARTLLYPITAYFLLKARPQRRASRRFLTRVLGRPARMTEVARHIHCFAATILDRVYLLAGRRELLDIHLHQPELVTDRVAAGQGFLLLGSHLGSFELLRALAIEEARMPLKILMYPAHNPVITELLHALNPTIAGSVISLDSPKPLLAVKESLDAGYAVGLLGDRRMPDEPAVICDFLGRRASFPSGPLSLAALTGVPVILPFGIYRGGNRYDVYFERFAERVELDRHDRARRESQLQDWVRRYADRLAHHARAAPFNWFNFYDFWEDEDAVSQA
ncbi:lipid A biosynthesis acyltransferase [Thiocystis violascens]|uniref:Putative acyltransferase n=1 Tax=Thiocystis violascens (strain ATCC 17096 / DSM 198 / 6111) TaxID=765911 RepID=I3YB32_THIV6|nr:lipid A biosynthesis acyltransferase [Thiocystis violascens]AFL74200.1 putative acyltransferase [Thiocystis violascens DSM 198]